MSVSMLEGLLDAIAAAPPLEQGLCVGNWDLFDNVDLPDAALKLCRQCKVRAQCAEWSAAFDNHTLSGVVAGHVRPWEPRRSKPRAIATA
jgi:hypothetical protein